MKKYLLSSLVVVGVLFSGCGDSSDTSEQPFLSSSYNLTNISKDTFDISLTGTDTQGGNWKGSIAVQDRGTDYLNGVAYRLMESYVYLMETNSGYSNSGITKSYINSNGQGAHMVTDTGVICDMINNPFSLPTNAEIGDFGEGADYVCSDGSEMKSNWQLKAEKGYAQYIYTMDTTVSGSLMYTNTTTITLDNNGQAKSLNMVYFYPSNGVKLTLNGTH